MLISFIYLYCLTDGRSIGTAYTQGVGSLFYLEYYLITWVMKKEKKCSKCDKIKGLSEFYKHRTKSNGVYSQCKVCQEKAKKAYYRTKKGLFVLIYHNQISSSVQRNHPRPNYTMLELREFGLSTPKFLVLYKKWVESGYDKELTPSFDRKDDYKPYTLDNLQVMIWGENDKKGSDDRRNGINNKMNKAVVGEYISTGKKESYHSMTEAERQTSVDHRYISKCCSGESESAGGYYWKLKNNINDRFKTR